jgi:hypothetical protein
MHQFITVRYVFYTNWCLYANICTEVDQHVSKCKVHIKYLLLFIRSQLYRTVLCLVKGMNEKAFCYDSMLWWLFKVYRTSSWEFINIWQFWGSFPQFTYTMLEEYTCNYINLYSKSKSYPSILFISIAFNVICFASCFKISDITVSWHSSSYHQSFKLALSAI